MARKKPGPKASLCNPQPIDIEDGDNTSDSSRVDASDLDDDEHVLREYLRKRRTELVARSRELEAVAASRIIQIAVDGLIAN